MISLDSYDVGCRLGTSDREEHPEGRGGTYPSIYKVSLLEKPQCLVLRLSCVPKKVGVNQ
jgi:hypothetical protein